MRSNRGRVEPERARRSLIDAQLHDGVLRQPCALERVTLLLPRLMLFRAARFAQFDARQTVRRGQNGWQFAARERKPFRASHVTLTGPRHVDQRSARGFISLDEKRTMAQHHGLVLLIFISRDFRGNAHFQRPCAHRLGDQNRASTKPLLAMFSTLVGVEPVLPKETSFELLGPSIDG